MGPQTRASERSGNGGVGVPIAAAPALGAAVVQHCAVVGPPAGEQLRAAADAEVQGGQGVAHLPGSVAAGRLVAVPEPARTAAAPALGAVVKQPSARMIITTSGYTVGLGWVDLCGLRARSSAQQCQEHHWYAQSRRGHGGKHHHCVLQSKRKGYDHLSLESMT